MLRATRYILYKSKMYAVGDELPANDKSMVDAWIEAGSAAWVNEGEAPEKTQEPEEKPADKKKRSKK